MEKIIKPDEIEKVAASLKNQGKTIALTNGCFDILHVGHARYLSEAKKLADILIIGVNSDNSVRRLKGPQRPLNNENDRSEMLGYFYFVNYTVIFEELTADNLLLKIKPDFYVKGGDYTKESLPESKTIDEVGSKVVFINYIQGYSTTKIIEKISPK